jgi:hypothetical protein
VPAAASFSEHSLLDFISQPNPSNMKSALHGLYRLAGSDIGKNTLNARAVSIQQSINLTLPLDLLTDIGIDRLPLRYVLGLHTLTPAHTARASKELLGHTTKPSLSSKEDPRIVELRKLRERINNLPPGCDDMIEMGEAAGDYDPKSDSTLKTSPFIGFTRRSLLLQMALLNPGQFFFDWTFGAAEHRWLYGILFARCPDKSGLEYMHLPVFACLAGSEATAPLKGLLEMFLRMLAAVCPSFVLSPISVVIDHSRSLAGAFRSVFGGLNSAFRVFYCLVHRLRNWRANFGTSPAGKAIFALLYGAAKSLDARHALKLLVAALLTAIKTKNSEMIDYTIAQIREFADYATIARFYHSFLSAWDLSTNVVEGAFAAFKKMFEHDIINDSFEVGSTASISDVISAGLMFMSEWCASEDVRVAKSLAEVKTLPGATYPQHWQGILNRYRGLQRNILADQMALAFKMFLKLTPMTYRLAMVNGARVCMCSRHSRYPFPCRCQLLGDLQATAFGKVYFKTPTYLLPAGTGLGDLVDLGKVYAAGEAGAAASSAGGRSGSPVHGDGSSSDADVVPAQAPLVRDSSDSDSSDSGIDGDDESMHSRSSSKPDERAPPRSPLRSFCIGDIVVTGPSDMIDEQWGYCFQRCRPVTFPVNHGSKHGPVHMPIRMQGEEDEGQSALGAEVVAEVEEVEEVEGGDAPPAVPLESSGSSGRSSSSLGEGEHVHERRGEPADPAPAGPAPAGPAPAGPAPAGPARSAEVRGVVRREAQPRRLFLPVEGKRRRLVDGQFGARFEHQPRVPLPFPPLLPPGQTFRGVVPEVPVPALGRDPGTKHDVVKRALRAGEVDAAFARLKSRVEGGYLSSREGHLASWRRVRGDRPEDKRVNRGPTLHSALETAKAHIWPAGTSFIELAPPAEGDGSVGDGSDHHQQRPCVLSEALLVRDYFGPLDSGDSCPTLHQLEASTPGSRLPPDAIYVAEEFRSSMETIIMQQLRLYRGAAADEAQDEEEWHPPAVVELDDAEVAELLDAASDGGSDVDDMVPRDAPSRNAIAEVADRRAAGASRDAIVGMAENAYSSTYKATPQGFADIAKALGVAERDIRMAFEEANLLACMDSPSNAKRKR